jgi:inner membrane protein
MDPLSQAVLGAALPQSFVRSKPSLRWAGAAGALAGMAPDLDVLIRSDGDPLLAIEYHRHFTHSLAFVPFGGLICAAALWPFFRRHGARFRDLALWCVLGLGTHGLLDACTSYGTQLLWPFSNMRVAWNNVAIVDPAFTLPLLLLTLLAAWTGRTALARIGMIWALAYLGLGVVQRDRAEGVVRELARERGHEPARLTVKPTVGNLLLFRGIYEAGGRYWVDAVRVGLSGTRAYPGGSIEAFDTAKVLDSIPKDSRLYKDLSRFDWFSDRYLSMDPRDPRVLGDLRFSLLPDSLDPLWGLRVDVNDPSAPTSFENFRLTSPEAWRHFGTLLRGLDLAPSPSPSPSP